MAIGTIVQRGLPIFMGLIMVLSLVHMIISAIVVSSYNSHDDYPNGSYKGSTRFNLFTSIWTIFTAAGYLAAFFLATSSIIASIASHAAWTFLTWIFWIAAAGSITSATSGDLDCGRSHIAHCYQLQAIEGFAWIHFILFFLLLVGLVFLSVRSSRNGNGFAGSLVA